MEKLYAQRDVEGDDALRLFYLRHLDAMTREKLHSKSDIAAELAYRDQQLAAIKDPGVRVLDTDGAILQHRKRSQQLDSISESIKKMLANPAAERGGAYILSGEEVHKINGWMEQLGIIADELKNAGK